MANMKQCCGCFDLPTASKIVGGIVTFTSTVAGIFYIACILSHRNILENSSPTENTIELTSDQQIFDTIFGICLGIEILIGLTGVLLVVGATKEKTSLMLPYMILAIIIIVLTFFYYGFTFLASVSQDGVVALICLARLCYCGVQFYWWMCVCSHYNELKVRKTQPTQYFNTPSYIVKV